MDPEINRRAFLKLALTLPLGPVVRRLSFAEIAAHHEAQALERPNILILVFDTLSAQHMSLYGYERQTTPNLDRFADRSTVYHAHYATGNFTCPGTASLLTGVYPWTHRAFNLAAVPTADYVEKNLFAAFAGRNYHRLAYSHNHLADFILFEFRSHLDTYIPSSAFLTNNRQLMSRVLMNDRKIANISEDLAFVRSKESSLFLSLFDQILNPLLTRPNEQEDFPYGLPEAFRANFTLETVVDGIHDSLRRAPQPFLGYFHVLPPHEPYRPRGDFRDRFKGSPDPDPKPVHYFSQNQPDEVLNRHRRRYDEYLAYADAEFGRLVSLLEQSGLLKNTVVVFTTDHGQLFERGIHGHFTPVLYEPVVRIPLLLYDPAHPFRRDVYTATSAIDLLPTLVHRSGGQIPTWCEGAVLPPYQPAAPDRSLYVVEAKQNGRAQPISTASVAVIQERTKLISYDGYPGFSGQYELYDLDRDPEERVDLGSTQKSTAEAIRHELEQKLQTMNHLFTQRT